MEAIIDSVLAEFDIPLDIYIEDICGMAFMPGYLRSLVKSAERWVAGRMTRTKCGRLYDRLDEDPWDLDCHYIFQGIPRLRLKAEEKHSADEEILANGCRNKRRELLMSVRRTSTKTTIWLLAAKRSCQPSAKGPAQMWPTIRGARANG